MAIDTGDRENRIGQRAYDLWHSQDRPDGQADEHRLQACRELETPTADNPALLTEDGAAASTGTRKNENRHRA